MRQAAEKIHDRRSRDLPINARVAIDVVSDPYSHSGEKIQVLRSIRDDPLARMYVRSQIDSAQFTAGRHWQKMYDLCEVGGASSIDPAKEAVDGGRLPEAITDEQMVAFRVLNGVQKALGEDGSALVRGVLGRGFMIAQIAEAWGLNSRRETEYLGMRFRECLERMAVHWGYAQPKKI